MLFRSVDNNASPINWRLWDVSNATELLSGSASALIDSSSQLILGSDKLIECHANGTGTVLSITLMENL